MEHNKESNLSLSKQETFCKEFSKESRQDIAKQIIACRAVQKTYGGNVNDIELVIRVFIDDLSQFEPDKIIEALAKWRKEEADFPTPADIKKILSVKKQRAIHDLTPAEKEHYGY